MRAAAVSPLAGAGSPRAAAASRAGSVGVEPSRLVTQLAHHAGDVGLHLLDARAEVLGSLGDVGDALCGLGARGRADLLGAALGGLDDRADLLSGLLGEGRRLGSATLQRIDLARERGEVGLDRCRVVAAPVGREVAPDDRVAVEGHGRVSLTRIPRRSAV
jgi:hypothetical protein